MQPETAVSILARNVAESDEEAIFFFLNAPSPRFARADNITESKQTYK